MGMEMMLAEPIDPIHADCLAARDDIRAHVARIRRWIDAWQPRPYQPTQSHPESRNPK